METTPILKTLGFGWAKWLSGRVPALCSEALGSIPGTIGGGGVNKKHWVDSEEVNK